MVGREDMEESVAESTQSERLRVKLKLAVGLAVRR